MGLQNNRGSPDAWGEPSVWGWPKIFSVKICVRYKCMCKGGERGWSVQGLLWVDALCSTASSSWGAALPPGHWHVPQTPTQVWELWLSMAKVTVPDTESHPCLGWLWDARQVVLYCWPRCHPENRELTSHCSILQLLLNVPQVASASACKMPTGPVLSYL